MEESKDHEISVIVTCQQLAGLAECACRMTGYADPNGNRLITVMQSENGTPVRLVLAQQSILTNCLKTGVFRACVLSPPPREKTKRICIPRKEALVCLAENHKRQRSRR
ncbi:hypothetical protein CAFE_11390 [Caprobacter fermentans]|uniref:Uncharacterized protein n=1 Tax=Caproicibacter fermentans TaxID=2576756 RepID=A0A6N8HY52_9FIRM|nr:hypothetical protein [Caproicibacter fermentans]MVB10450.1 hypothetical protein [Caproicibacter fermentans]